MKTYLFNIIPRLQQFSQELDNTSLLTSQHWIVLDEGGAKLTYIFRPNGDLLISREGQVQKSKWEYIGNHTLLIESENKSLLFRQGFFNEQVLALQLDPKPEYALLVSPPTYESGVTSLAAVQHLLDSYLEHESQGRPSPKRLNGPESTRNHGKDSLLRKIGLSLLIWAGMIVGVCILVILIAYIFSAA